MDDSESVLPSSNALPIQAKKKRHFWRWVARVLLILLFVLGFGCALTPWGQAVFRSSMTLPGVLTGSEPSALASMSESIEHSALTVSSLSGTVYLDVYAPKGVPAPLIGKRGAMLLVTGSGDNRTVSQLVNLMENFARTGMVVMNVTTSPMLDYDLSVQDGDAIVQAYLRLAQWPGVDKTHVGIVGFSAGTLMTSLAAADPRIRDTVAYITLFGGYFQTTNVLRAFASRSISSAEGKEFWQPAEVPIIVLTNVFLRLLPYNEQASFREAIQKQIKHQVVNLNALSPTAQAAFALLTGSDPEHVEQNLASLPPIIQAELEQLSPRRVISEIRAPVFLLHDRHDPSLPYTESRDFAQALQNLHHSYEHVEFDIFDHVEVRDHLDWGSLLRDGSRLAIILNQILALS